MSGLSTIKKRMHLTLEPHAVKDAWGGRVQCACDSVYRAQNDHTRHLAEAVAEQTYKIQQAAAATRPPNPPKRKTELSEHVRETA